MPNLAQSYIDVEGLGFDVTPAYLDALGLEGEVITNRLYLLRQLVNGAGVTVYTGPRGAQFWTLASFEVNIEVVPDGYTLDERTTNEVEWSLRVVGADPATVKSFVRKPPTKRHGKWSVWEEAEGQRKAYRAVSPSVSPIINRQWQTVTVLDTAEQRGIIDAVSRDADWAALDWEWTEDDERPLGMSLSTADRNWYFPCAPEHGAGKDALPALTHQFTQFISSDSVNSILHNAKSDMHAAFKGDPLSLVGKPVFDSLVMAYVLGKPELGLKPLTETELDRKVIPYPGKLETKPLDLVARYAGSDTRNTFDLFHKLREQLEYANQWSVYTDIEQNVTPVIASMEKEGTPIDPVALQRFKVEYEAEEAKLIREAGADLSDDDTARDWVTKQLGYDPGGLSKDALAKYDAPWADLILRYRQVRHRRRSFVDKHLGRWEDAGRPPHMVAYSRFNQAGSTLEGDPRGYRSAPRSGRLSSSGDFGNLQNQPRDIRAAFVAPEGYKWWSFDYSGLELHLAAALSRDPEMLRVLGSGGDLHTEFQQEILRLTGVEVERVYAKAGNFEQLYGGGAGTLVKILQKERAFISHEVAQAIVDAHKMTYKTYHEYADRVVASAYGNGGSAFTLFGRARNEREDLFGQDPDRQQWAARALVNVTNQGTAADVLKMAMVRVLPVLKHYGAHMSIQVHDEVCGYVKEGDTTEFEQVVTSVLQGIEIPGLRLKVEGGTGANWGETK